jgi:putative inorganic carbon (hco3(-)) transporter
MLKPPGKYLPASLQDTPEKLAFVTLAACVSLMAVSIAASQILLAVALFASIPILKRTGRFLSSIRPILMPLLVFSIWTMVATLASPNAMTGVIISKKFLLFLIVPLVPLLVRGEKRLTWIYRAVLAVACISSLLGVGQFLLNPHRDLMHRISGFMGHWMTYSGLLMIALVLLAAYALSAGWRSYAYVIPAAAIMILALILSQTRNAWMGTVAGISVLILVRRPRAFAGFIVLILVLYFVSPASIKHRFTSGLDPKDANTRNRIELYQTSVRIIRDHPWLGVGPQNVKTEALKWRGQNEFPDWMYMHMHNNILQIASATGITGLTLWFWLMIRFAWDALRIFRWSNSRSVDIEAGLRKEALVASSAAIGVWVALAVAGVFEYNFGDSEVLMLFLFMMSAPYAFRSYLPGSGKASSSSGLRESSGSKSQGLENSRVSSD